ncbi:hypothetical protein I203_102984 [Kwoniella mangroviensis CBS 8507]|uniref:uncharacterized protein n=1 Tax=Kwoniella mangroviensis CBS 8507 TaxID=1296122 RepID=UPI00080CF4E3|nr:uncharacterized protein I203_03962 [Kwoniella mangroviensis CBS 8507]OCF67274.1 hypothetical protein I203_03962 [Kwoniella mangroviensis CBS 8507]
MSSGSTANASASAIPFTAPHPLSTTSPQTQTQTPYTPGSHTETTPLVRQNLNEVINSNSGSFSVIRQSGDREYGDISKGKYQDWEEEFERSKLKEWEEKVGRDLKGWRGGNGKPRSYYALRALPPHSYFHQPITGTIGKHLPKEIVRIERDWSGGEVCQFDTVYPMELEGRIQPHQMSEFVTTLNEILYSAYSVRATIWDNLIAVGTLWTSLIWRESHFEKELQRAERFIQESNKTLFNPQGLNLLSPRYVALQFVRSPFFPSHNSGFILN